MCCRLVLKLVDAYSDADQVRRVAAALASRSHQFAKPFTRMVVLSKLAGKLCDEWWKEHKLLPSLKMVRRLETELSVRRRECKELRKWMEMLETQYKGLRDRLLESAKDAERADASSVAFDVHDDDQMGSGLLQFADAEPTRLPMAQMPADGECERSWTLRHSKLGRCLFF